MSKGKILIIDDSVVVRNYLSTMISSVPNLEIVSSVPNGHLGFQKILSTKPDVVILDLVMADGDALYVLQQMEEVIPSSERPFVIIYSSTARHGDPTFTKALNFGFCDFALKVEATAEELIPKLRNTFLPKILSGIEAKKTRELLKTGPSLGFAPRSLSDISKPKETNNNNNNIPSGIQALKDVLVTKRVYPKLLIIGASTGGPQVVREIVQSLDPRIKIPIVIIQHMPEGFTKSFAKELEEASSFKAHELQHSMPLENGNIYVFPGGMHGRLSAFGNLFVYYSERKDYTAHPFKPSINLAIEHLMDSLHGHVILAILSGMGTDGAIGAQQLHSKGSFVIAQDEASSAVWGMPRAVVKSGAADIILSQDELGKGIQMALTSYYV